MTFDISCTICFQQHPPPLLSIYLLCWLWQRRKINWIKAFVYTSCSYSDLLSLHQILVFANKRQSICSLILFAAVVGRNRRSHSQLWKWQLRKIEKLSVSYLLLSVVFLVKEKYFNTNCLYVNGCKYKTLATSSNVNASVWWKVVEGLPSRWCEGENM